MTEPPLGPGHRGGGPIEFWFDFASGYAYFAGLDIDSMAKRCGREVRWTPFSLGSSFKVTGAVALTSTPLKSEYALGDWRRLARRKGVPFKPPSGHPVGSLPALRAFYHVEGIDPAAAQSLAKRLLLGYFQQGLRIDDPNAVAALAAEIGIDPAKLLAGLSDPVVKARAKAQGDAAVARGIFGSPWFIVDGEPFWGHDRIPMIAEWLERGPW